MNWLENFKKFALRGNLVELAIGFTVGAAFTTVAQSLVNDILMPPIGLLLGRVDFADLFLVLKEGREGTRPYATVAEAQAAGAVTLNYGIFINNVLALLVVALAMFFLIRLINQIDNRLDAAIDAGEKDPQEPSSKKCPYCRTTIDYKASRCPHCTSHLPGAAPPAGGPRQEAPS